MAGLAENLLECALSAGSYGARPYDVGDIDAHPDCDRIWATIRAIRDESFDLGEVAREEAIKEAEDEWQESVADSLADRMKRYQIEVSMKDGDTGLFLLKLVPSPAKPGEEDIDFLDIDACLEELFDRESEHIAESLGDAGHDLAEMRAEKETDRATHARRVAELKDYVSAASAEAKMEHYDRRVLRSGTADAALLNRLKKPDLVRITAVALSLAYGRKPRP